MEKKKKKDHRCPLESNYARTCQKTHGAEEYYEMEKEGKGQDANTFSCKKMR